MRFETVVQDNRPNKFAGNNVTIYFRSAFIEVLKTSENAASDGFVCVQYNTVLHYAVAKASAISRAKKNIANV